jgi:hypothetical protein
MFNPGGITLAELSSAVRDLTIIGVLLSLGWKSRALVQPIIDFFNESKDFFSKANHHMIFMETSMGSLLNNHLAHLKQAEPPADEAKR